MVGSHEFYLGYAVANQKLLCLDAGHFHPTETIADKISSVLLYLDEMLLHVSRGVRWDSDHVVILNDDLRAIAEEIVRGGFLDRVHIGLDYFDASINRVAAWVIGMRAMLKALLLALLEPTAKLRAAGAGRRFHRPAGHDRGDQDAAGRRRVGLLLPAARRARRRRLARRGQGLRSQGDQQAAIGPRQQDQGERFMDTNSFLGVGMYVLGGLERRLLLSALQAGQAVVVGKLLDDLRRQRADPVALDPGVYRLAQRAVGPPPDRVGNALLVLPFRGHVGRGRADLGTDDPLPGRWPGAGDRLRGVRSAGTLVPPAFRGELAGYAHEDWGIATLVGVGIACSASATGAAGMSKERELSEEQKKAAVAEFHFSKGILVGVFSGIMSAGMAFGLDAGKAEIERAALHTAPAT